MRPKVSPGTIFEIGDGLTDVGTPATPTTNCNFSALLLSDGNFVVYRGNNPIWATNTAGKGVKKLAFQPDGNLVLYDAANKSVWQTSTYNRGVSTFLLSTGGSLVLVDQNNGIVWSSGPSVNGCQ